MYEPTPHTLGRYELVSLLGRGGHGEVWRARKAGPMGFTAEVAVKVLFNSGSEAQLQAEARLGALLRLPNVVAVHGLEEVDGRWLMEMELVEGQSLHEVLKRRKVLSPRALVQLGQQVLEGLIHIHELAVDGTPVGLVHRDIKPGNLLIDGAGAVRIADLGVACLSSGQSVVGTIGYASPEQLRGDVVDGRADLFSLVAVLVRCCGQRALVGGRGDVGLLRTLDLDEAKVRAWVAPVDEFLPGLAPMMARWLAPRVAERPRDARAALREWSQLDLRYAMGISLAEAANETTPDPGASLSDTPEPAPERQAPEREPREPLVGREDVLRAAELAWGTGPVLLVAGTRHVPSPGGAGLVGGPVHGPERTRGALRHRERLRAHRGPHRRGDGRGGPERGPGPSSLGGARHAGAAHRRGRALAGRVGRGRGAGTAGAGHVAAGAPGLSLAGGPGGAPGAEGRRRALPAPLADGLTGGRRGHRHGGARPRRGTAGHRAGRSRGWGWGPTRAPPPGIAPWRPASTPPGTCSTTRPALLSSACRSSRGRSIATAPRR